MDRREFLKVSMGAGMLALLHGGVLAGCTGKSTQEKIKPLLSGLPYKAGDLAPYLSEETLTVHYGKHHEGYVTRLVALMEGTPYDGMTLVDIVRKSAGKTEDAAIFNNAAQALNHGFYWQCMRPDGGGEPDGELLKKIEADFKSYKGFREAFTQTANGHFGSGWAWLVQDAEGKLRVTATTNADTPATQGLRPLLTLDVWEHAYYLDYQNRRADYVEAFLDHLVNWPFVAANVV